MLIIYTEQIHLPFLAIPSTPTTPPSPKFLSVCLNNTPCPGCASHALTDVNASTATLRAHP